MHTGSPLPRPLQVLLVASCIVILLAGMRAASPLLGPVFCAGFVSILFIVLKHWLERRGLSAGISLLIVIFLYLAAVAGFIAVIGISIFQLLHELPAYRQGLGSLVPPGVDMQQIAGGDLSTLLSSESIGIILSGGPGIISRAGDVVTASLLVVLTPVFILAESAGLVEKGRGIITHLSGRIERAERFGSQMIDFLVVRTEVNLANGVANGLLFAAIGVDFAILWGFLAFVLGYVVYVGFWLAIIPPMVLAWLEIGPSAALMVLAGAGIINTLAEYLLFPHMAGHRLNLSPLVVFLSIFFWYLILGSFGVLLAVPLTMAVQAVLETWDETRWLGELLGK